MFDACMCSFSVLIELLELMLHYVLLAFCCVFVDCSLLHFGKTSEQRRTPARLLAGVTVTPLLYCTAYVLCGTWRGAL